MFSEYTSSVEPRQPLVRCLSAARGTEWANERVPCFERHAERPHQLGELTIVARDLLPVDVPELRRGPRLNQHAALILHDVEVLVELGEERLPPPNRREHLVAQRRQPVDALDVRIQVERYRRGILDLDPRKAHG